MLASLDDPEDPGHEECREWLGEDFDPERFSPAVANATLAALFEPGGRAEGAEPEAWAGGWSAAGSDAWREEAAGGTPPDPEVLEALDVILEHLEDVSAEDPRITGRLFHGAVDLLLEGAERFPERFLRSRKLEGWAAGALHAAGVLLPFRGREDRPTLEELARAFGIALSTVDRRSLELRAASREASGTREASGFGSGGGPGDPAMLLAEVVAGLAAAANEAYESALAELADEDDGWAELLDDEEPLTGRADEEVARREEGPGTGGVPPHARPHARVEELLLAAEGRTGRSADAFYRDAADLLSAHADQMEEDELRYLIRRGLKAESDEGFRRFLALGLRHFGLDAAAWAPSESGRRPPPPDEDGEAGPSSGGRSQLRLI